MQVCCSYRLGIAVMVYGCKMMSKGSVSCATFRLSCLTPVLFYCRKLTFWLPMLLHLVCGSGASRATGNFHTHVPGCLQALVLQRCGAVASRGLGFRLLGRLSLAGCMGSLSRWKARCACRWSMFIFIPTLRLHVSLIINLSCACGLRPGGYCSAEIIIVRTRLVIDGS